MRTDSEDSLEILPSVPGDQAGGPAHFRTFDDSSDLGVRRAL